MPHTAEHDPILTPTLLARAYRCLHFAGQEKFAEAGLKVKSDAGLEKIRAEGRLFETELIGQLDHVHTPAWDGQDWEQGRAATLELMKKGVPWIHNAILSSRGISGRADLLKRVRRSSKLGKHSYYPIEIKHRNRLTEHDTIQLAAYAAMLRDALGSIPSKGEIWITTEKRVMAMAGPVGLLQQLLDHIRRVWRAELRTEPMWCQACPDCSWADRCMEERRIAGHLSLLPSCGRETVETFYRAGIRDIPMLAARDLKTLLERVDLKARPLEQLWQHARARCSGRPVILSRPEFPTGRPIIYYDIETMNGTVVLHGVIKVEGGRREERQFFAPTPDRERDAWLELLDYISLNRQAIVYMWTHFEKTAARHCWERYQGDRSSYEALMNNLTDQFLWIKRHFALPTRSYSIKEVAPLFGFQWRAEDAGGANCEAWYIEYLKTLDGGLKQKILDYNMDDVRAMEAIDKGLRKFVKTG